MRYSESIDNLDLKNYRRALILNDMTMIYCNRADNIIKGRDSVLYFLKKSLEAAKIIKNSDGSFKNKKPEIIAFTNVRIGIYYLEKAKEKGSLAKAENHLLESYKIYENKKYKLSPYDKTTMLNQMSWLYMEKKEYGKSIELANRALQNERKYKDPSKRSESFEFLATGYLETGEKEKAKFYLTKYTFLKDSLNMSSRNDTDIVLKKIIKTTDSNYDEKSKNQIMVSLVFLLISGSTAIILWRRNNKKLHKNYEYVIEKLKNESVFQKIETKTGNRNVISTDTENRILDKLKIFENSEEFLKLNITISWLSNELNTNAKYLSEVIKIHKSHSFSSYINHLKIDYIVHKLYNEPKYRDYKISHLAELSGYASPQVFFSAFKKINKVTPAYFIQKLKENEV